MADTDAVVRRLRERPGVTYIALVPNQRGLDRAVAGGIRTIALFTAASEAFAQANIGMGIDASLGLFRDVAASARAAGVHVRGYISTAWWCPFSGRVDSETVRRVALELLAAGCDDVDIADTIGAATPAEVSDTLERLMRDIAVDRIAVHFHDTRGTALANVLASLAMGIATIDASTGGLGGCPFAPGALGNLASEDLLYMLQGMGIETRVDLEAVRAAAARIESALGRPLPSRYLRAGPLRLRGGASRSS
jgi:hydroxymethylglutaryl-CoA lyase